MEQTIKCFNEDTTELLKSGELQKIFPTTTTKNMIYLDLPYGGQSSDYPKLYSFLEEYIYMKPLSQIEKIQKFNRYAKKKGYEEQFVDLLETINSTKLFNIWVLSYNESSWKPIEEIVALLKKYKSNIIIKKREYQYNYRKNETEQIKNIDLDGNEFYTEQNNGKRSGTEFLIICKD
jgi:hypothetical protein